MSRRSPLRHPIAVIRGLLGLTQRQLAGLAGVSAPTIQSIELGKGRLNLSRRLAYKISNATQVDPEWLLQGNPDVPPIALDGSAYTIAHFKSPESVTSRHVTYGVEMHDDKFGWGLASGHLDLGEAQRLISDFTSSPARIVEITVVETRRVIEERNNTKL